ncbi:MAG: hypothetical protein JWL98_664 [Xanthomonadaceae bacterium]|nr:hypothetical protein [Xanthomonadaceae bacterium]
MAPQARHRTSDPPPPQPTRKPHPLFWLLVLIAVLTLTWAAYNQYASETTPALVLPSAAPAPNAGPPHP